MKIFLFTISLPLLFLQNEPREHFLIVGTYTGGKSEGIYVYAFNSENGTAREVSHVKTSNPSFLAISPNEGFVYAVHENGKDGKGGDISAFAFDKKNGSLRFINLQPTGGDHPCYVAIDHSGKWVFAGNYSSGSLSVFPVQADGSLGKASSHITHSGSGPMKDRQDKPHVHCTYLSPDNKWLYVPDLGMDKVMIYSFDESTGQLSPGAQQFAKSPPGSGPRHLTFHPNGKYAYVVEELSGHISAYRFDNGNLKFMQRTSTIARGSKGYPGSADIHVSEDGKFLYVSNRGDFNNLAFFKVDPQNGKLNIIGFHSTLGKTPRNFNFDPSGKYLLVANQDSDEIVIFSRNTRSGLITDSGNRIPVGKPVCLKWVKPE